MLPALFAASLRKARRPVDTLTLIIRLVPPHHRANLTRSDTNAPALAPGQYCDPYDKQKFYTCPTTNAPEPSGDCGSLSACQQTNPTTCKCGQDQFTCKGHVDGQYCAKNNSGYYYCPSGTFQNCQPSTVCVDHAGTRPYATCDTKVKEVAAENAVYGSVRILT